MDRLCQLASSLLERSIRQSVSTTPVPTPTPIAPIVINRIRTSNRFHFRYRRRQIHPRTVIPTLSIPPQPPPSVLTPSTRSSSQTDTTQRSVSPSLPTRDNSRESLISLYWLFQDNINSPRNPIV